MSAKNNRSQASVGDFVYKTTGAPSVAVRSTKPSPMKMENGERGAYFLKQGEIKRRLRELYPCKKTQKMFRHKLMRSQTPTERLANKFFNDNGIIFQQNKPIGKYFVDFYFPGRYLFLELDGESHEQSYDFIRDKEIRKMTKGFCEIVRMKNKDVSFDSLTRLLSDYKISEVSLSYEQFLKNLNPDTNAIKWIVNGQKHKKFWNRVMYRRRLIREGKLCL